MMRRRSVVYVVSVAVMATVLVTAAISYAIFQEILGTESVSASVNIVSESQNLKVCSVDDLTCSGTIFTGDLSFGDMTRDSSATVQFVIKHIEAVGNAPIFVDIRLKSGDQITPFQLDTLPSTPVLTGDVPGLGKFVVRFKSSNGNVTEAADTALVANEARQVNLDYTAASDILPGLKSFDILIDVVNAPE